MTLYVRNEDWLTKVMKALVHESDRGCCQCVLLSTEGFMKSTLKLNIDLPNLASEPAPSMFTHPPIIYV